MSSTDDRIVRMQFDNAQFKKGAQDTQKSLADLDRATAAAGKSRGLMDLASGMTQVGVQASKMAIVTTTALATIANKVVNVGINMAKSLTLDPLKQGFSEYESMLTKQNVIQNATGKSAKVVKGALNELNTYSDKTIYSFGNMTDAIQKFVNAGVPLKTSVTTIKGIANAAAFAGASSEEANRAMYAFSQSMSLGFVQLQDWNQIENANLGTIKFKNELLKAGVAAGTLTKKGKEYVTQSGKTISATKGWRDGLQEQWATTKVLNSALGKYADTSTKLGRQAFKSAQEVRTFSAFMDTLKESIGSGWSQIFTSLIGNLGQSTKMWTGLSNVIGGAVKSIFNWLSISIKTWRSMGGFQKVLQGFKNILAPIGAIFDVIGTSMRAAFPNSGQGAGKGLYALSAGFEAITRPLQLVAKLIRLLTGPMTVFFLILKIGGTAVREFLGWIGKLVGGFQDAVSFKPSDGGFIDWLKELGSWLISPLKQISNLVDKGKSLGDAFKSIKMPKLSLPSLPGLPNLGGAASGAGSAAAGGASKAQTMLKVVGGLLKKVGGGLKDFVKDVGKAGSAVGSGFFGKIGDILGKIGDGIKFIVEKVNWQDVLASFNIAVFATFALSMSRMFNAITEGVTAVTDFKKAGIGVMEDAGTALKSFQTAARAKLILNIAIAIGILAVSLWILSKIPLGKTAQALVAMGAIFLMLNATMKSFTGLLNSLSGKKVGATALGVALAIAILAGAMFIMAGALILFNFVNWSSIAKGLVTMFALVKAMSALGSQAAKAAKNMIAGAFGIYVMSAAMLVLAAALIAFKLVDWTAMSKAGTAIAVMTVALMLLSRVPAPTLLAAGAAMLAISVGMVALAIAMIMLAVVKWESIGKLAVVLAAVAIAISIMMATGGIQAAFVILALAAAMIGIAAAGIILNKVNWSTIGKIALILTVLTLALAAVGVVSYFVGPALLLLGAAMFLLGLGLLFFTTALSAALVIAAAGTAGFAAFATAAAVAIAAFLTSLALQAPIMKDSFLKILQALIDTIVEAVPMVIKGIKDLFAAIIQELGGGKAGGNDKAQAVGDAGSSLMQKLGDAIKKYLPIIIQKGSDLLVGFIRGMVAHAADIGGAAAKFVAKFIQGIANNIGGVITAGKNLIIKWIQGISNAAADIAVAAAVAVLNFINALSDAVLLYEPLIIEAVGNLGINIVKGMIEGIKSFAGNALDAIGDMAHSMVDKALGIFKIFSPSRVFRNIGEFVVKGLTLGIQDNASSAIRAVASMVTGSIAVATSYVDKFIQDLDQKAIAARARADGLAAAAQKASNAAQKTKKNKKDDAAAKQLEKQANAASKQADALEAQSDAKKAASDRAEEFNDASLIDKAKMRSEDAQNQLDAAKAAEKKAAAEKIQADALVKQSKVSGVTPAQRKEFLRQAAALRAAAATDAKRANDLIEAARLSAVSALDWQKKAGDEAAAQFQAAFEADAKDAADADAFEKMSATEKAALRRKQAADLQAQADKDLATAKQLAYTDLDAANDLAALAQKEAEQARKYLDDADSFAKTPAGAGGILGTVVDTGFTDTAAAAMRAHEELYSTALGAAAGDNHIEFNQYNSSPEALSPTELYRLGNNQFTFAVEKIDEIVNPAA